MRIQHCLKNLSVHEKNLLGTNRVSIVLEDNVDYSHHLMHMFLTKKHLPTHHVINQIYEIHGLVPNKKDN